MPTAESRLPRSSECAAKMRRKSFLQNGLCSAAAALLMAAPWLGCMRSDSLVEHPGGTRLPSEVAAAGDPSSGAPQLAMGEKPAARDASGKLVLPSAQFTPLATTTNAIARDSSVPEAVSPAAPWHASEVDTLANAQPPRPSIIPPPPLPAPFANSWVGAPVATQPAPELAPPTNPPMVSTAAPTRPAPAPGTDLVSWPVVDRLPEVTNEQPAEEPLPTIRIRPATPTPSVVRAAPQPTLPQPTISRLPATLEVLPPVDEPNQPLPVIALAPRMPVPRDVASDRPATVAPKIERLRPLAEEPARAPLPAVPRQNIVRLPEPVVPAAAVESDQPRVLNAYRPPEFEGRNQRVITPEKVEMIDAPQINLSAGPAVASTNVPGSLPPIVHASPQPEQKSSRRSAIAAASHTRLTPRSATPQAAALGSMTPEVRSVLVRPQTIKTDSGEVMLTSEMSPRSVSVLASRVRIAPPPAGEERVLEIHPEAPSERAPDYVTPQNSIPPEHPAASPEAETYDPEGYVVQEELLPPPTSGTPQPPPRITIQPPASNNSSTESELLPPAGEPGLLDPDQTTQTDPPQRFKPLSSLTTNIAVPTYRTVTGDALPMPADYATEFFANQGPDWRSERASRYGDYVVNPQGLEFCYQPLYYEEVNVERYGLTFGVAQPVVSAAQFYGRTAVLPFMMVTHPPRKCACHPHWTLPGYRSCWEVPDYMPRPDAAAVEAAFVLGLILLIP